MSRSGVSGMVGEGRDSPGRDRPARPIGPAVVTGALIAITAALTTASPALGARLPADPTLSTVHDGPFEAGGTGTFSIDVTPGPFFTGIGYSTEITYYFPTGLTPVRASGAGWRCRITVRSVSCDTPEAAAPGFQLPRITVGVAVAADASGTLTVSGRAIQTTAAPGLATELVTGLATNPETGPSSGTVAGTVQIIPSPRA